METIHVEEEAEFFLNFTVNLEIVTEFAKILKPPTISCNFVG